jgi:hypothetical protein
MKHIQAYISSDSDKQENAIIIDSGTTSQWLLTSCGSRIMKLYSIQKL